MWLFTRHGFYSVTRSVKEPDKLQIRARSRGDLERLSGFILASGFEDIGKDLQAIIETPVADYRYRVIVTPGDWLIISVELMNDIEYHNFKDQISDIQRHNDYLGVWSIMNGTQRREIYQAGQASYFDEWEGYYDNEPEIDNGNFGDPPEFNDSASFFWGD